MNISESGDVEVTDVKRRLYAFCINVQGLEGVVIFTKPGEMTVPLIGGNLKDLLPFRGFAAEAAATLGVPVFLKSYVEDKVLDVITPVERMMMGKNMNQ